ncbi:DUF1289 domain-containing protein [Halomonas kenyensis]|uniref:DUF1289 domain-containing protein n=2 Tax=Billgrantia kenyensis TaxID=321266 RepID=A0A7V9VYC4_9GAMM|nr:DUF1289 domain-containing protein [Halomonas kenyensis]MBA2777616.1 DUF1289 domain-containing protein [Halomonas kenyensis]MCG6660286.1 DUF1289 domain-containing protein [Halomonas kenyensis]
MCSRIASPCVGLCSTTLGDPVCRGCQRTDEEITAWPGLSVRQRENRMAELDSLRVRVAGRFLRVVDEARLEEQMRRHRIRYRADQPALSRAVELLRVGRDRIREIGHYGLEPAAGAAGYSAAELHARMSEQLLEEASARRCNLHRDLSSSGCSRS